MFFNNIHEYNKRLHLEIKVDKNPILSSQKLGNQQRCHCYCVSQKHKPDLVSEHDQIIRKIK